MPEIHIDRDDYQRLIEHIGRQIDEIVNTTIEETADLPAEEAADMLHARVSAVEGMNFDRAWSLNIIESLRRGENVNIQVG